MPPLNTHSALRHEFARRSARALGIGLGAALALPAAPALADFTISLRTDANTSNLYLDQAFTVEVVVSGLEPGQELSFLGVTVTADAFRVGTPGNILPGDIVPAAMASPMDFLTARAPGMADASFESSGMLSAQRVTSDGVFFTFELTPQHAGDISIEVSFADALLHNPDDPTEPIPVEIVPPEPLGAVIFCPADFNQDGGIDGADVVDFFAAWEAATGLSDVNGDGGVDGDDVSRFFDAWENASC